MDTRTPEEYEKSSSESRKWNEEHPRSAVKYYGLIPKYVNVLVWACGVHRHKYYQELMWESVTSDPPTQRMAG